MDNNLSEEGGNGGRINVSVAVLRAELAALELRIYQKFQDALALKAEVESIRLLDSHIKLLEERERQNELSLRTQWVSLERVEKYKKWLIGVTLALASIIISSMALYLHLRTF